MNVLGLCAGIGGIERGLKDADPSVRTVCLVEREAYCIAVLVNLMQKGILDDAPIWTDLTTFKGKPWRGIVDCITAGFPCQPFSVAGRLQRDKDERWIWPSIYRIVRDVEPSIIFLENVPALANRGLPIVLGTLAHLGYDVEWDVFSAAETSAPHRRKRLYILARFDGIGRDWRRIQPAKDENTSSGNYDYNSSKALGNLDSTGLERWPMPEFISRDQRPAGTAGRSFPPFQNDVQSWLRVPTGLKPAVCRVAYGLPNRIHRIRALGNSVVPATVSLAYKELTARMHDKRPPIAQGSLAAAPVRPAHMRKEKGE